MATGKKLLQNLFQKPLQKLLEKNLAWPQVKNSCKFFLFSWNSCKKSWKHFCKKVAKTLAQTFAKSHAKLFPKTLARTVAKTLAKLFPKTLARTFAKTLAWPQVKNIIIRVLVAIIHTKSMLIKEPPCIELILAQTSLTWPLHASPSMSSSTFLTGVSYM